MITTMNKLRRGNSTYKIVVATLFSLLFLGCSSSSSSSQSSTVSGVAIDGYIVGAKACLDINSNQKCDSDEPSDITKKGGIYTIVTSQGTNYPIVVEVNTSAYDESTGTNFSAPFTLFAPSGKTTITPITTMVQQNLLDNNDSNLSKAQSNIATLTGVNEGKLYVDYIDTNDTTISSKASGYVAYLESHDGNVSKLIESLRNKNDTLTLNAIPNSATQEDTNITIDLNATDTEGNTISYTADSNNTNIATVSIVNGKVVVSPVANANGVISVEVNATANGLSDTQTFELNVTAVDDSPSFTSQIANQTINEDSPAFSVMLTASDVESNPFTYYASASNNKVTLNLVDDNLTITPTANANGDVRVDVNVTQDNNTSLYDAYSFTVHINPVNDAPTIDTSFNDISLQEDNGTTNYELNVSDIDGDDLNLTVESNDTSIITVTPNWSVAINQAKYASPLDFNLTTETNATGTVKISITLSDINLSDSTSFDVNVTAIASRSTIKKTGQTKSYDVNGNEVTDNSLKDDGFYQKGVTPSYTRDDTNDTVTDNLTHLMWQDDETPTTMTWSDAKSYCDNLNLGGYTDWKLPTRKELVGLINYGRYNPAVDSSFQNVSSDFYWTSTTVAGFADDSWIVYFYEGTLGNNGSHDESFYVRCVRAEEP